MFPFQAVHLLAAASDPWAEFFFGLDQDKRFVLMLVAIGCATGIIISLLGIISGVVTSMNRIRREGELKRDMLDRGMSAEEIARVVESTPPTVFLERWASGRGKSKKS
jgi:hypothetical protein